PSIELEIVYKDGHAQSLYTQSQKMYLLPWIPGKPEYDINGEENKQDENYNIHISQALFDLLPDGFLNKNRLTQVSSPYEGIADQIIYIISDKKTFFLPETKPPESRL
ncbi:MAG: hypothetical protein Q8Q33_10265, partial [Chlamydiota bacterium]|nr:hypothetical protein [Chlamydiota bacterium]